MLDKQGAHTRGHNHYSIGICCIGNFDNGPPSDEQWQMCMEMVRSLMRVFDIPVSQVHGHNEFDRHKSCPGKNWDAGWSPAAPFFHPSTPTLAGGLVPRSPGLSCSIFLTKCPGPAGADQLSQKSSMENVLIFWGANCPKLLGAKILDK